MKFDEVDIFNVKGQPVVIAGPCSAESEEQVMQVAAELVARGVNIFRAGIWKPRTRPGCFEGVGREGLSWLARVKRELGMYITTEVATAEHVEQALGAGVDILWVGARTTTNPFAVQEVADALRGCDVPVLVKNPVNPDIELWIGAMERLVNAGITRLGAIHRGFSSYGEKCFRNAPQWQLPIELRRRFPGLPMLCDPSHIAGKRELILTLAQQAMDLDFDGLMIETHSTPYCALSDARQQVTPDELVSILGKFVHRVAVADNADFQSYRDNIDKIDRELVSLLSKRMEIAREIGELKREKGMMVFQPMRYNEIMERYMKLSADGRLEVDTVREIFELIHSESIRQQLSVMNNNDV